MSTRRVFHTTLLTAGCLLLLAAFPVRSAALASAPVARASQTAGTLTFDQAVPISSVDPVNPLGYPSAYEALFLVGNTLVTFNGQMQIEPSLAIRWHVMKDQKTWVFTLRSGVTFQDGTPFTAQAVQADFDRMLNPTTDPTQQGIWSHFAAVKVINAHTVHIVTKQPFAATLDYLAHGSAVILHFPATGGKAIGLHPVGTGAYMITSFQPGTQMTLSANPRYWGGKPALKQIVLRAVPNAQTRIDDLRSGHAQLIDSVPAVDLASLRAAPGIRIDAAPSWVTTYLEFNTQHGPLTNPLVRRALGDAIDTRGIIKAVFDGYADPLASPLAPSMPSYVAASSAAYSTSRALALLRRAGYTSKGGKLLSGGKQLHLTFTAPTGLYPNDTEVAQAIQQELQSIGIAVTLHTVPASSYFTFIREATPTSGYGDMFLWAFNPSNGDPGYTLAINFGKPGTAAALWNKSFYNSPALQTLLAQESATLQHSRRLALLGQAQHLIAAGAPAAWLYAPRNNVAMSSAVSGVTVLPVEFLLLGQASMGT
jgi:ABC-type transport system substrate-binding protein